MRLGFANTSCGQVLRKTVRKNKSKEEGKKGVLPLYSLLLPHWVPLSALIATAIKIMSTTILTMLKPLVQMPALLVAFVF